MGLDKDTLHVVIRLPFQRPPGFVEPPSIVWTDEMEHKLWLHMSKKETDWNLIAEQLGVPTSYVVRHAAFVYETQLRGIHQQLRMNGNNSTMSRNSAKSPTPSKPRPTSIRYSNSLQYHQQLQQQPQQPHESQESSSQQQQQKMSNDSIQRSRSSSRLSRENLRSTRSSLSNTSMYKSSPSTTTNSRIQTVTAYVHDSSEESDVVPEEEDTDEKVDEKEDEEEFSTQFERMRLQVEEPAFLPQTSAETSNSLSNSRQQLSMSIQNLRKRNTFDDSSASSSKSTTPPNTHIHTPLATASYQASTAPGSSNESALNSMGSSFSDLSDSSVTQSALEEAFMSKFNQGSKMSLMNSLRRYKE